MLSIPAMMRALDDDKRKRTEQNARVWADPAIRAACEARTRASRAAYVAPEQRHDDDIGPGGIA